MSLIEKDGQQSAPSFEEQMRAAEAEAGIPPDAELYGQDEPEVPEPVAVEAEAVAEPEPEPEPEPVVEEKPDQLAEVNKKLGQIINENAELRRQLEEYQQPAQQYQQQQYPLTQETVSWFEQVAQENPQQAVAFALQQQQPILYEQAMQSWYEQDPRNAARFERQAEMAQLQQTVAAQIQPQLQDAHQMSQNAQLGAAVDAVKSRHEDFAQVIGALNEDKIAELINGGLPTSIVQDLVGDQTAKERVIETMYRWVKAEQAGLFTQAAGQVAQVSSDEARQAKLDATVASATTTTPDSVAETEQERMAKAWQELTPSLRDGWTGRDSRQRLGR